MDREHAARIEREAELPGLVNALADRLSGSDLQSLLLEVFRRRAEALSPADLLRRYESDRFVAPAPSDPAALVDVERRAFALLPESWHRMELSPVAPLGTSSVLGRMSQNRLVSTVRGQEVAADATNTLALEAALRRRRDRSRRVRLCSAQRVVRAQPFEPPALQHFRLFVLVSADRAGNEDDMLAEHVAFYERILDGVDGAVVTVEPADGRYYERTRIDASVGPLNLVDGGFTDWTQRLLGDAKERLLISGVGTERLLGASR